MHKMRSLNDRRRVAVIVLTIVGIPFYIVCWAIHACMAGHMAHPPYSVLDWTNDAIWVTCFVASCVFVVKSSLRRRWLIFAVLTVLTLFQLLG